MKKVTVTISKDGTAEVDVNGVKGSGCEKYTKAVLKALGGDVIKDEKKPEYYETTSSKVKTSS